MSKIFTIGHSTHNFSFFLELIKKQNISVVADVRSTPYSGMNPDFNKDTLIGLLKKEGIRYVYLGNELGGRSDDPNFFDSNGRVNYNLLSKTDKFNEGLNRLEKGVKEGLAVCLMCSEKRPLDCHRSILVARHLVERQYDVIHILEDGKLEGQKELVDSMIKKEPNTDLFKSEEDQISEAYDFRASKVAYKKKENKE